MPTITVRGTALHVEETHLPFWERMAGGFWEATTLDALDAWLGPETTFVDIGAWIGPTALYAAPRCRRVIAYEADPAAAAQFRANVALNPDLAGRIDLVEKAVAATEGEASMGARGAQGDSMSSLVHSDPAVSWRVATETPAQVAARLDPDETALVKIDIEGGEYALADALAPLARRPRTAVLLSFHPRVAAGGHPRWHRTIPITHRLLAAFRPDAVWVVGRRRMRRAPLAQALIRAGAAWFEAKGSYLLVNR